MIYIKNLFLRQGTTAKSLLLLIILAVNMRSTPVETFALTDTEVKSSRVPFEKSTVNGGFLNNAIFAEGNLDPSFSTSITEGFGYVNETVVQPDDKIISVGLFYLANGTRSNGIVRLNADGTLDGSFNGTGTGADSDIRAVALQADGKILIGGNFLHFNGQVINRLARLNPDGSVDNSFNNTLAFNDQIFEIAVQSDGSILLGGKFNGIASNPLRGRIARLNPDGTIDTLFSNGGSRANGTVYKIIVEPDNKILVGGAFSGFNGAGTGKLVRLTASGIPDTSLNTGAGPSGDIRNIILQPDGKILICGTFQRFMNTEADGMARLNSDGTLAMAFDIPSIPGVVPMMFGFALQPDGKIVSSYNDANYHALSKIIRMNPNGTVDPTFSEGILERFSVRDIATQTDGKLLIGGDFVTYNDQTKVRLFRTASDGTLDPAFNPKISTPGTVYAVRQQTDGKILIGGDFEFVNGVRRTAAARLNIDGSLDSTFDLGRTIDGDVYSLLIEPSGTIIMGGSYVGNGTFTGGNLHRINPDGSFNTSLGSDETPTSSIFSIDRQLDGKIVVAGFIFNQSYSARVPASRFNVDGTLDSSFLRISLPNGVGRAVLVEPDGKIVVGGSFFSQGTFNRSGILRLNPDGSLDSGFSGGSPAVYSLASTPSGKIISAGFDLRRYSADGNLDTTLNTGLGVDSAIRSIVVQPDDKIVIGGHFSTYNGITANRLARIQVDGSRDLTFDVGSGVSLSVLSLGFQSDSKLLVGGQIVDFNGALKLGLLRLAASNVIVSGRVTTPDGRGLRNASVALTDSAGIRRLTTTSSFGFYTFENVRNGETYVVGVSSKRYRFASRNLEVSDNITNVDFIGLE